ncbi:MAG TPA: hypothetical protein VEW28_00555, partial [Candidatus Kapabacteria bacterium]|nr:hypothetical protein [Candidatus Kapabacteria bacterium]
MRILHSLVSRLTRQQALLVVLTFVLLQSFPSNVRSQLSVNIAVLPPYSPSLDVWMSNPSRVLITIINTDPTHAYNIRLAGSAKNSDETLMMETKQDAPAPQIEIGPGGTKQLNLNDFRIFDVNTVRFKGTSSTLIARTHILPDGIYTICVQALDYNTRAALSPDAPGGCANFEIRSAEAPTLISPSNEAELEPERSQVMQFQWLAPIGAPPILTYQFSIVEIQPKQAPEGAFLSAGRAFGFNRDGLNTTNLTLQSAELKLQSGKIYAWRVRAIDPSNTMAFKNDGYSAANIFKYGIGGIITKPKLPDTLVCGTFEIVVQKWDDASKSADPKLPSGIGCVQFDCKKKITIVPPWLKGIQLQQKSFNVVSNPVQDSSAELHISEAQLINPDVKVGDKLSLNLPQSSISKASQIIDKTKLIDWWKKFPPLNCIRVAFHDVKWSPPTKPKVILTEGIATYPTIPPSPVPPAMLVLDSGFTLAIDSLILTPTEATVEGKLLLPTDIISADTCTRAFLKLPKTTITSNCEFYKEVVTGDSMYGRWWLGGSGVLVHGDQYVIDFSSTQSAGGVNPPLPASWKGVVLRHGATDAHPDRSITSNRGYTKALYTYTNALIMTHGFDGELVLEPGPWSFNTLEPYGYIVQLRGGHLEFANSEISGGSFNNGFIALPVAAIQTSSGTRLEAEYDSLEVQNDMDLFGRVKMPATGYRWGEYSRTTGTPTYYKLDYNPALPPDTGSFYLSARQIDPYYPADSFWHSPSLFFAETQMEAQGMQGVLLPAIRAREFTIFTPDVPQPPIKLLRFAKETIARVWINVIRAGIHSEIDIVCDSTRLSNMRLGDSLRTKYDGKESFITDFGICFNSRYNDKGNNTFAANNPKSVMPFQFCESAVWNSDLAGEVHLPKPAEINVAFKNMMFTSTADCAGGQVDLSKPDSLPYWGVKIVAKDTAKSAGIVCARLGVIYLTAAGISEKRHYSQPFWLTWGELKADGNLGRMYFDYNSVGQRFDGFPFSPFAVRLSDYVAVRKDTAKVPGNMTIGALAGSLYSYGMVSVHFFGGKLVSLSDYLVENTNAPYNARWVREQQAPIYNNPASDIHWQRNWGGGIANFDYTQVLYDSLPQVGFYGTGTGTLLEIIGGISSSITIRADHACFSMSADASHDINLAVVANFSAMEKIWGCGCILGDNLERIVIGGELSTGGGVGASLIARAGAMVAIKLSITPTQTKLSIQGDMYAVLASSINAEVSGVAELTEDHGAGYVEGYLKGDVSLSTFLTGVTAEGELQWHFGLDYQMIQGRVAVGIYGPVQLGMESGVFLGNNCPKSKIWVTDGINSRFSFNKGGLPTNLTGLYAYISISQSVNLYIVSGGYEVYIGVGAFLGTSPPVGSGFGVMGNVGVRI